MPRKVRRRRFVVCLFLFSLSHSHLEGSTSPCRSSTRPQATSTRIDLGISHLFPSVGLHLFLLLVSQPTRAPPCSTSPGLVHATVYQSREARSSSRDNLMAKCSASSSVTVDFHPPTPEGSLSKRKASTALSSSTISRSRSS